jgi:hypothetical protein
MYLHIFLNPISFDLIKSLEEPAVSTCRHVADLAYSYIYKIVIPNLP